MSVYRESVMRGYYFEDFVFKLFEYYKVEDIKRDKDLEGAVSRSTISRLDFYLNNKIFVEVKSFSKKLMRTGQIIESARKMIEELPSDSLIKPENFLLIVGNVVNFEQLKDAYIKYPDLKRVEVIDIRNILYLIRGNDLLLEELYSILDYSTEEIEMIPPKLNFKLFDESNIEYIEHVSNKSYIEKLSNWVPQGKTNYQEFEKLCVEILKRLLSDNLMLWSEQQRSNEDLYRFDLICKIKSESYHDFWNIIKDHFDTRYLVFEFKNYGKKISQKEIYTTEKYLYGKALRSVAIMISPEGEDVNSKKAIKGTLRENGKLILSLKNEDLIKMLEFKEEGNEITPSDYLSKKLDDLLINLDK